MHSAIAIYNCKSDAHVWRVLKKALCVLPPVCKNIRFCKCMSALTFRDTSLSPTNSPILAKPSKANPPIIKEGIKLQPFVWIHWVIRKAAVVYHWNKLFNVGIFGLQNSSWTTSTICVMFRLTVSSDCPVCKYIGFFKKSFANDWISRGQVAVNLENIMVKWFIIS